MLTRRSSSKETTTLCWEMPDDAWAHWTQGRGEKSVRDVILEGIDQIRKSPEAVKNIRKCCEGVSQEDQGEHEVGQSLKHKIEIQLPSGAWGEACQLVGSPGNPVCTSHLLAAVIHESESWQQVGNDDAEFSSGWHLVDLDSSLSSLTTTTAGFSLGREEKNLARMGAWAAVFGALAAIAIAVAAWCNP